MGAATAIDERLACGERFFAAQAERIARLCHAMAERFARGGRLIAFGSSPADLSDVRHVAVEFVHPVIVGKRALPGLGLPCADVGLLARPGDMAMAFGHSAAVASAVRAAREADCLTVAFSPVGAEWEFTIEAAAGALRDRFSRVGKGLALGNGGSATDAMDAVADLRRPPAPLPSRPAIDLTEDAPIITAVANDVGVQAIFARQVIAYGHEDDGLLSFSTSGNSENVIAALTEARRSGLLTIAFVGYDGGRIAGEQLADHVVVTRSEHIPRIQEAQASAWHVLRGLVEQGS